MKKLTISKKTWSTFWLIVGLILFSFALWGLSGCMTEKKINKFKQQYCRDSVSIQIKDRIVKIPVMYQDSAMLEMWFSCDSAGTVYFNSWQEANGKYIELKKKLDSNKLTVKSYVYIKDTVFTMVHDTVKFQQANTTTNILTKSQALYYRFGKWSFWIIIAAVVIALVYTFFKFKSKILGFFKPK